jgi:hypothetical protein
MMGFPPFPFFNGYWPSPSPANTPIQPQGSQPALHAQATQDPPTPTPLRLSNATKTLEFPSSDPVDETGAIAYPHIDLWLSKLSAQPKWKNYALDQYDLMNKFESIRIVYINQLANPNLIPYSVNEFAEKLGIPAGKVTMLQRWATSDCKKVLNKV